ncbi:MAG: hypothetical protein ACE5F9_10255 [Phycisphaerae bacterium]
MPLEDLRSGLRHHRRRLGLITPCLFICVLATQAPAKPPSDRKAQSAPPSVKSDIPHTGTTEQIRDDPRAIRWRSTLLIGATLVVVLVATSIAIIVFSRNFRRYLMRRAPQPTPNDDVWQMHKLPEELDEGAATDAGAPDDDPPFGLGPQSTGGPDED